MKRISTFLILLGLAVSAQAATVAWNILTPDQVKFDTKSVGKNATAYVVFLGTQTISDYSFKEITEMKTVFDTPTALGKVNNVPVEVDSVSGLGNYGLYMTYVSDEKTYYNISSSVYTLTAADVEAFTTEGTAIPASSFSFSNTKNADTATPTTGGGWYASVPEPSTAMLALAGLALLIKRRRA